MCLSHLWSVQYDKKKTKKHLWSVQYDKKTKKKK